MNSSVGEEYACNAGDWGSIPGSGRSPGEGNGNPLQYSCLENPTDRGAWQATVHGIARVGHDLATKPPTMLHSHCSEARGFCSLLSYSETQSNGTNCLLQYYQLPRPTERGLWKVLYKQSNVLSPKRSAQNSLARISHMVLFNHMLYEAHPSFEKKEGELCMW